MSEDLFVSLVFSNTEGIVLFCNAGSGKIENKGVCSWEDLDSAVFHLSDPSLLLEKRWKALTSLAKSLYHNGGFGEASIKGLSFSGTQGILVFLDASGKVLSVLPEEVPSRNHPPGKGNQKQSSPCALAPSNLFEGDRAVLRLHKIRTENPELLKEASALLFLSDWVGYKLSGRFFLDSSQLGPSALVDSPTGILNRAGLGELGIPAGLFPQIRLPGEKPLTLTEKAAEELGFPADTPLVWGGGDVSLSSFRKDYCTCLGSPFSRMIALGTLEKEHFFRQLLSNLPRDTSFSGKPGFSAGLGALLCAASAAGPAGDPECGRSRHPVFPEGDANPSAEKAFADVREILLEVNRSLFAKGWITYTGGNISVRSREDQEEIWITPGGINKEKLDSTSLVRMDLSGRLLSKGPYKPSSEFRVHTEIFLQRKDIQAVIHTHTPYVTLMGLTETKWLPISAEGGLFGTLPVVPFFKPGTEELALRVAEALGDAGCCVLMQNHGLIVGAGNLWKAAELTEILELQAFKLITCRMMGIIPKTVQPF